MFCQNCGTENKEDNTYCCNCGAKLLKEDQMSSPMGTYNNAPSPVQWRQAPSALYANYFMEQEKIRKKRPIKCALIVIIVLLFIIVLLHLQLLADAINNRDIGSVNGSSVTSYDTSLSEDVEIIKKSFARGGK